MSASGTSHSVLLPAASVVVFSDHSDTCAAVAALQDDWRFARVKVDVQSGDVASAIMHFQYTPSPELLIVDTDTIDQSFTTQLEALSVSCAEHTNAVVVGPVNDVYLYRNLVAMGVSDYLVRPITTEMIADVIARVLLEQMGASESNLIAVVGAKGGVGTSTVAGLLAYGIAEQQQEKAVLFDVAGGRSYLNVSFGMEPVGTFTETTRALAASDPNVLNRMLQKFGLNLQVLGTGNDKFLDEPFSIENFEKLIDRLLSVNPFVIADLSGAPALIQRTALIRAQRVFLVTSPVLSSLRLARTLLHEIKDLRGGSFEALDLVVNMLGLAPGAEVPKGDIESAIEHKVAVTIPFDPKMIIGAESQAKVLGSVKGVDAIVQALLGRMHLVSPGKEGGKASGKHGNLLDNIFRMGGK